MSAEHPLATITFRGTSALHPPLRGLRFDIELRNDAPAPRWFLLPSYLGAGPPPARRTAYALEAQLWGTVPVGHLLGDPGLYALLLPAGARLSLIDVPCTYSGGDLPGALDMQIATGAALTLGGEDVATWFGRDPTAPPGAQASAAEKTRAGSRQAPGLRALPLELAGEEAVRVHVALDTK
jgi:hypothetical protein